MITEKEFSNKTMAILLDKNCNLKDQEGLLEYWLPMLYNTATKEMTEDKINRTFNILLKMPKEEWNGKFGFFSYFSIADFIQIDNDNTATKEVNTLLELANDYEPYLSGVIFENLTTNEVARHYTMKTLSTTAKECKMTFSKGFKQSLIDYWLKCNTDKVININPVYIGEKPTRYKIISQKTGYFQQPKAFDYTNNNEDHYKNLIDNLPSDQLELIKQASNNDLFVLGCKKYLFNALALYKEAEAINLQIQNQQKAENFFSSFNLKLKAIITN
jgi:hypothetical protein